MLTIQLLFLLTVCIGSALILFNLLCYIPFCFIPICPPIAVLYFCICNQNKYLILLSVYMLCVMLTAGWFIIGSCTLILGVFQIPFVISFIIVSVCLSFGLPCYILSYPLCCILSCIFCHYCIICLNIILPCIVTILKYSCDCFVCNSYLVLALSFMSLVTCGPYLLFHFIILKLCQKLMIVTG